MRDNLIYTKSFAAPPVDRREVLRYAGVRTADPKTEKILDDCISQIQDRLSYKVCYRIYDIEHGDGETSLEFTKSSSALLRKRLDGCEKIVLFCATVGVEMDRLIARASAMSSARAVLLQALGSERVEALCDEFCASLGGELGEKGLILTPRFSPGYGDLPLEMQRDVFASLECSKRIGVSLGEDLFMTPTKSVTAIIGIKCKS